MSYATDQMQVARWANHSSDWPDGQRKCTKCGEIKPNENFHKHSGCKGGYNSVCKDCRVPISQLKYKQLARELRLYNSAKSREAAKNREFNIDLEDIVIPDLCPVFGTPMVRPSLDRIDNKLGYIKGNVRVISYRANALKSDASIEELEMVLADMKRISKAGVCELVDLTR